MSTTLQVEPEKMAVYRATARRRWKREQQKLARRQERGWQVTRRAATLLKEQFGATQVMVFGSLVHNHWFSSTSDIDLAVWGLPSDDYFVAVAKLQDLSSEFKIDLIAIERCQPALWEAITQEGVLV